MNHFVIIIKLAFKRFFTKKRLGVFLLVLITSLVAFHMGVMDFKDIDRVSKDFKNIETNNFVNISSWERYGEKGIGVFFIPSPEMVFFAAPSKFAYLNGRINTIADLDILQNRKEESVKSRGWDKMVRFSNIMLYIATLLAMLVGYVPMRDREYLRQLAAVSSSVKTYAAILIAGFFILVLGFLVIAVCIFLLGLIEGIVPSSTLVAVLVSYLPVAFLMLLFFLMVGSLIGNIRSKSTARTVLFAVWFIFVFIIPVTLDTIAELDTNHMISALELHGKKLKVVQDFENSAVEKYGEFNKDNMDVEKKIIEDYWNTEYKKMEDMENEFLNGITAGIKRSKSLSLTCITTFYQSVCDELSSNGYTGYLDFYHYLIKLRREFVRFRIDHVFYKRSKEVKNFITGNENLYFAHSRLPENFWTGVLFSVVWVIVFTFLAYLGFQRALFPVPGKRDEMEKIDLKLYSGNTAALIVREYPFVEQVLNVFWGKAKHFAGKISIDGENIVSSEKKDFVYIASPSRIPEMSVREYIRSVTGSTDTGGYDDKILDEPFSALSVEDRAMVQYKTAQKMTAKIYIFDNLHDDAIDENPEIQAIVTGLEENGAVVLYFTRTTNLPVIPGKFFRVAYYEEKYSHKSFNG